jgi:hypothetical protein
MGESRPKARVQFQLHLIAPHSLVWSTTLHVPLWINTLVTPDLPRIPLDWAG